MTARVACFWDGDAWRVGVECSSRVVTRGKRKGTEVVTVVHLMEGRGVVAREYGDYKARDVHLDNGKPYPLRRARAHYRRMGQRWGITKGAEEALREAA